MTDWLVVGFGIALTLINLIRFRNFSLPTRFHSPHLSMIIFT